MSDEEQPKKKKKKKKTTGPTIETARLTPQALDACFASTFKALDAMKLGISSIDTVVGADTAFAVGLELPSLALQYLFKGTVFPLGACMAQIVGEKGMGKSAMAYEIARWFVANNGLSFLIDVESKVSPDLYQSILRYNTHAARKYKAHSLEMWQKLVSRGMVGTQEWCTPSKAAMKKDPTWLYRGRSVPAIWIVDSISGKMSEDSIAKIQAAGNASRDYAIEAMLNQSFVKTIPIIMEGWPFFLLAVNHLKKGIQDKGAPAWAPPKKAIPGGAQLGFQEMLELEIGKPMKNATIKTGQFNGNRRTLKVNKNSYGETGHQIEYEMIWWYAKDPMSSVARQQTRFLWGKATTEFLLSGQHSAKIRRQLQEASGIEIISSGKQKKYYSERLGMDDTEATTAENFGNEIMRSPKILSDLHNILGIRQDYALKLGDNYPTAVRKEAERRRQLYEAAGFDPRNLYADQDAVALTYDGEDGSVDEFADEDGDD